MKYKVKLINVGRENFNGEFIFEADTIDGINDQAINEISKHLLSSNISFEDGKIYAGFHNVGEIEFEEAK